jgi:transcription initiation factor TFIIB
MATALGLGKDIRTTASQLFRQATNEGLLIGRSIEGIASACLYIGTRTFSYPRSFDEVAHVSRVDRNHIVGCYTTVRDEFELELGPVDPKTYLPRVVANADANPSIERTAREIIEHAQWG